MADSFEKVLESPIHLDFGIPRYRHPILIPEDWHDKKDHLLYPTDPPQKIY